MVVAIVIIPFLPRFWPFRLWWTKEGIKELYGAKISNFLRSRNIMATAVSLLWTLHYTGCIHMLNVVRQCVIVITFYSPSCLGRETAKGPFRSSSLKLPPAHLSTTHGGGFTLPLDAERQAGKLWRPIFKLYGLTRPEIESEATASVAYALSTRPLIVMSNASWSMLQRQKYQFCNAL